MTRHLTPDQAEAVESLEMVLTKTPLDVMAGNAISYMARNFQEPSDIDPEGKWKMPRLEASAQVRVCVLIQRYFEKMLGALRAHDFSGLQGFYTQMMEEMTASSDLPNFPKGNRTGKTMEEDGLAQVFTVLSGEIDFLAGD